MTWVKICGITNLEDAEIAVEAGADAIGFVFHPTSPRLVDARAVGAIAARVPATVEKIGVFVDRFQEVPGLTGIQLHFAGPPEIFPETRLKKFLAVSTLADPMASGRIDALFLDASGGKGRAFDWDSAAPAVHELNKQYRVVVAGGLTPRNVTEAIRILKPWGVDVSSGVEAKPGKKDPQKVRDFIKAVRKVEVSVE